MSTLAPSNGDLRTTSHRTGLAAPSVAAVRCVVTSAETIELMLYAADQALGSIVLGPADAVRIASDLLNATRPRLGRSLPEE